MTEDKKNLVEEIATTINEAIGEASMLWDEIPKGVFESDKAIQLSERTMEAIRARLRKKLESMGTGLLYIREILKDLDL